MERNACLQTKLAYLALLFLGISGCGSGGDKTALDLNERVKDIESAAGAEKGSKGNRFRFGFDLRASPQEDARQYLPFLHYLEHATGYSFELQFTPKGTSIADELGTGRVQFAAIGATSYIKSKERYGAVAVARGLNSKNQAEYQSIIVVSPDSAIKSIEALRGKRFAFGSIDSTQGHLIPRIMLGAKDIGLEDLADYTYTGSHRECVNAVVAGKADACGMQDTMAREMASQGLVRILATSAYYPSSGIAANKDVPQEVIKRVRQALLDFKPQGRDMAGLYAWNKTEMPRGFSGAAEEDYTELRRWLLRFGMLEVGETASGGEPNR